MKFTIFAVFAILLTAAAAAMAQQNDASTKEGNESGCEKKLERYVAGSAFYEVECEKRVVENRLREPDADALIEQKNEEARRRQEDDNNVSPFSQ